MASARADGRTIMPPPVRGVRPPALGAARILVVRADRLGDVVLSLPVLGILRARWPAAHLGLLTSAAVAPLLVGHPWIDTLIADHRQGRHAGWRGFRRLRRRLAAGDFDVALVLRPTPRHAALVRAAGIRHRTGTAFRAYSWLFNQRVELHRRRSGRHELELNLAMLAALAGAVETRAPWLPLPAGAQRQAVRLLGEADTRPLVVLHPGSGGSARQWPPAHFAALAARLLARGCRVAVTGSAAEAGLVAAVAGAGPVVEGRGQSPAAGTPSLSPPAGAALLDLAGRTPLPVLAAMLAAARVVVAGSTGPLHLAAALGTAVVGLFPPLRDAAPARWAPWSRRAVVLEAPAPPCPRCTESACAAWDCMAAIAPEAVSAHVERLLGERGAPGWGPT